jgi:arylsulfatase A-like enzyme
MKRKLLTTSVLCSMAGLVPTNSIYAQDCLKGKQKQPNIIFILADDIGYEAFGCDGGTSYKTPNIDRMAKEGMLFNLCYSQPLSAPSRSQLMTGKYNFRNYHGFGVMDPGTETFGNLLKDAGYVTGVTGKWQLYGDADQQKLAGHHGVLPREVGFDHYFLWHTVFPNMEFPDSLKGDKLIIKGETTQREARYKNPVILTEDGKLTFHDQYGPQLFERWAENFIDENKDRSRPFFLYYPMVLMHDPFQPTPNSKGWENSNGYDPSDPKYFGDMMEYMDMLVGRLIKKVNDAGIADNTIIIFTGDNGTNRKIYSQWCGQKIRGDKGFPQEWGIHVPFVAYWKGHIKAGSVNNNMIDFTDILPTFMDIAGTGIPAGFKVDGMSILDQLLGKKDAPKRDNTFGWYDAKWISIFPKAIWIQDSSHTWKLYHDGKFYNLKNDPDEKTPLNDKDLTKQERGIKNRLMKRIEYILAH